MPMKWVQLGQALCNDLCRPHIVARAVSLCNCLVWLLTGYFPLPYLGVTPPCSLLFCPCCFLTFSPPSEEFPVSLVILNLHTSGVSSFLPYFPYQGLDLKRRVSTSAFNKRHKRKQEKQKTTFIVKTFTEKSLCMLEQCRCGGDRDRRERHRDKQGES